MRPAKDASMAGVQQKVPKKTGVGGSKKDRKQMSEKLINKD